MSKYINPFTDFGFKKIFGEEENKDLLIDFLNELLIPQGVRIVELSYKKDTQLPITAEDRKVIFDLYCENETGEKFIIELQKAKQEHFKDRLLYYSTFSIQDQGKRGTWNYQLKAVYVVAILDFAFEEVVNQKVVSYYKMLDIDTKEVFTEKLSFVTVEMPSFTKTEDELETNLDKWLYLLKNLSSFERIPPRLQTQLIEKVFKVAEYSALSKRDREKYDNSLKDYNDLKNSLDTAENIGFEKSQQALLPILEEERRLKEEERRLKEEALIKQEESQRLVKTTILNLQNGGFSLAQIAAIMTISEAEIEAILASK